MPLKETILPQLITTRSKQTLGKQKKKKSESIFSPQIYDVCVMAWARRDSHGYEPHHAISNIKKVRFPANNKILYYNPEKE